MFDEKYLHYKTPDTRRFQATTVLFILLLIASVYLLITNNQKIIILPSKPSNITIESTSNDNSDPITWFVQSISSTKKYYQQIPDYPPKIQLPPISIDRIAVGISSYPDGTEMLREYLKYWADKDSSMLAKKGYKINYTIFWSTFDNGNAPLDLPIKRINEKNSHKKWTLMILDLLNNSPDSVDWFYLMDDDTIPFFDKIIYQLSKYPNPRKEKYLLHSSGERISEKHLGNGGAGQFVSRALAMVFNDTLVDCMKSIPRGFSNGDVKLDICARKIEGTHLIFPSGMFHMDPKGFRGDITGFIEGFLDRNSLMSIHHFHKKFFNVFPKKLRNRDDAVRNFTRGGSAFGDRFLKRYICKPNNDKVYILNNGYSVVVFNSKETQLISKYLTHVEQTFETTPTVLYERLSKMLIPPIDQLERFYIQSIITDPLHTKRSWQYFNSYNQTDTSLVIFTDEKGKIHCDDNIQTIPAKYEFDDEFDFRKIK